MTTENPLYLDNHATTQPREEVMDLVQEVMRSHWGNPSSMHAAGKAAREVIEEARGRVAALIGSRPAEIVFTSGGTEADNLAIRGTIQSASLPSRIITTAVEHAAVLEACRALKKTGVEVTELPVDREGRIRIERLEEALAGSAALVSCMWANNETGVIMPVAEAAARTKAAGGVFHSDAIQAVGRIPVNVRETGVDLLSLSAHKIYAPKGCGALFIRSGLRLSPQQAGGHHEHGMRGGTEATALIAGFGLACELAASEQTSEAQRLSALRDRLENGIAGIDREIVINGAGVDRLPGSLNFSIAGEESERLVLKMSEAGIAVSSGSACTSGIMEISHVLRSMSVPERFARGTIRIGCGRTTEPGDVDRVVTVLARLLT